jgi:dTDP-4-dehydrorhamnose reductase
MRPLLVLTGGSGLLSLNCALLLRGQYDVVLLQHKRNVTLAGAVDMRVDLGSVDAIRDCLEQLKPKVLIHAAGLTDVAYCEKNPSLAHAVNAKIAGVVAEACEQTGTRMVHISTDHLSDGTLHRATETDKVEPLNVYGKSKLCGEQAVLENNSQPIIVRTNFFGWGTSFRASFSDFIYRNLSSNKPVNLYSDILYSPILIADLCVNLLRLSRSDVSGVFNVVGDDVVSKYQFGVQMAKFFRLNADLINPVEYFTEHTDQIKRPRDMSLSNRKISDFSGQKVGGVDDFFIRLRCQMDYGQKSELSAL